MYLDETKPSLNDDDELIDDDAELRRKKGTISRLRDGNSSQLVTACQAILLLVNLCFLLGWIYLFGHGKPTQQPAPADRVFSAKSALSYHFKPVDTHDANDPFTGPPSQQVDDAWSDLLSVSTIRISQEELQSMNRTSVELPDGSGYLAYLETYHMLHCVKRIYQYQYPEYYPDVIRTGELTRAHWEHCLQVLRKGIMCNAGPSVNTYNRDPSGTRGLKGDSTAPRECVNWGVLEAWAGARAVSRADLIDQGLIVT